MLDDRFRSRWTGRLGAFATFDTEDPRQVDGLAGELLGAFVDQGDVESFALLCELTTPWLRRQAVHIVSRFGLPLSPVLLVDDLRRELFGVPEAGRLAFARAHFLAWAREALLTRARALEGRPKALPSRVAGVGGLADDPPAAPVRRAS